MARPGRGPRRPSACGVGRFDGAYRRVPWEGHFRDYRVRGGMRVPSYGEVGWYEGDRLELVWRGSLLDVEYELGR